MSAPLLVSVKEAAAMVSLTPASVYGLLEDGIIESVWMELEVEEGNRRRLVVYSSLVEFVDGLTRTVSA